MRIGVDCDGVIYDFVEDSRAMIVEAGLKTLEQLPVPVKQWDLGLEWDIPWDVFGALCDEYADKGVLFNRTEPYPDAVEVISCLREEGHTIHIMTNRWFGSKSVHNTVDWLARYGFEYDTIHFLKDKTKVSVDVLLEDYERHYNEGLANGQRVVLMNHDYNAHLVNAERVFSWKDFLGFIRTEQEALDSDIF